MLIENFLNPPSVVVYGASTDPTKMGGRVLANLLSGGYGGKVHVIHPKADVVQGLPAHSSAADLAERPAHAIICVPGPAVEAAMQDAIAGGVTHAQILSAGFAEMGEEGRAAQSRLLRMAQEAGVRFSGPNALGCMSAVNSFTASFSGFLMAARPPVGDIAIITQSGAVGTHVLGRAVDMGLGISHAMFTGNEGDLEAADFIEALAGDPATRVICCALETCSDGPKLKRALLAAAQADKPVFILKIGVSEIGAEAAMSHTGRMAGNDAAYSALFEACGTLRATSLDEMLELALVASVAGRPANNRLAVMSISGGVGIMAADAAAAVGVDVAPLPDATLHRIAEIYPLVIGRNPLDTTANAGSALPKVGQMLDEICALDQYGSVYMYFSHVGRTQARLELLIGMVAALKAKYPGLTVILATFIDEANRQALHRAGIANIIDPDRAIAAIGGAARSRMLQAQARAATGGSRPALPSGPFTGGDEVAARAYLEQAGLRGPAETLCTSADQAVAAAARIGFPVVAKIVSQDLPHKTEIGGVVLDIRDADAMRAAYDGIMQRARAAAPEARIAGVSVIEMVRDGAEVIIGGSQDPVFGPMVMVGLGGTAAELFHDVALAPAPVTAARAREMILGTRSAALLTGWRGGPALDLDALGQALAAVSHLVADPAFGISEIDINPFRLRQQGGLVLDALIVPRHPAPADPKETAS
ncbi:CoA-binding protein [Pseudooceanicola sp. 216_PA32_1]|uniref:CoA-binding protein n=1 Tax=Pseudooceanicola pacificus TaxID=2676438 RepID=A0A844W2F4_9RHOB|nr:acetate--CoA ligase family protein [Pseudooceanicola pacificus]MWB76874.1 CoA-binding protein [Pseudooceanicola pacificus]